MIGAAACLLALTACSGSHTVRADSVKAPQERKTAPDFALKDINGKTVRLSDFRGKTVMIDFWATWCGPCRMEIPWFVDFERKYKDKGFAVIGVAMDDEGWKVVKPFVDEMKMNYRVVIGNDMTADLYGGIEALPTTVIVDRDGKIASVHVGLAGKKDFEDAIEKLLQTPAVVSVADVRGARAK
jgi:peroxiredoxin